MEVNKDTTIFVKKGKAPNIVYLEIANNLERKKIADIKLEKITSVRYHVREVQFY